MLKTSRLLFLDFQTTGAKPETGEILEIAWATTAGDISSFIVKPERTEVSPFIRKMTGIVDSMLETAGALDTPVTTLQNFVKCYNPEAVIIHYAKFETPFLSELSHRFGFTFHCPVLCTHEIAKRVFPNLPARGVAGLAGYFGLIMKEKKRGADHVEATRIIWSGLVNELALQGIHDLSALQAWLLNSKPAKKTKYEYPLEKKKRLNLPEQPGIYRMLGKNGEVLYVGKATSLRSRVNSYFRGQKKRNSFKLQMLAQVWDIGTTVCDTALEAALLESDEIKKWNPRYNIALKTGDRELIFYSRDFTSSQNHMDRTHFIGPVSSRNVLMPILRLAAALDADPENPDFPEDLLFEKIEPALLKEGFRIFCGQNGLKSKDLQSVRYILAKGMRWYKEELQKAAVEAADLAEEGEEEVQEAELQAADEEARTSPEAVEYTAEEISEKFLSLFCHSASALHRSKKLKKLLNCEFDVKDSEGKLIKTISVKKGSLDPCQSEHKSSQWSIATYDRLSVLYAESKRLGIEIRRARLRPDSGELT